MTARPKKPETGNQAMKTVSARVPVKVAESLEQVAKSMDIPQSEVLRIALGLGGAILEAGAASIEDGHHPGFDGVYPVEYYNQYKESGAVPPGETDFLVFGIHKDDRDWRDATRSELRLKLSISGAVPVLHELVVAQAIRRLNLVPGPDGEGWQAKRKRGSELMEDIVELKQKLEMVQKFERLQTIGPADVIPTPYFIDEQGRRIEDSVHGPESTSTKADTPGNTTAPEEDSTTDHAKDGNSE